MDYPTLIAILDSTLRLATPLLLACLAGLYSERSGVVDIGLEGKMLMAAMASGVVAYLTGNVWAGVGAAIGASILFSMIHGLASITFRGNQLISGVALNFLASGLTVLIAQALFHQGGRTPALSGNARFSTITLPFEAEIRQVPILGPLYSDVLSGHSILVYVALLAVPVTWWVLYRTRFGLRLRAVGENPESVDTAGISVVGMRYGALVITGLLCGLAGAYMSTGLQAGFGREMIAGRGYIALAALIFANWHPWRALGATMLFGFLQALALRPDVLSNFGLSVPDAFLDALPYVLTVIVLAGVVGKPTPPKAGGQPYVKER
ncbi:ABC transporter permease [Rhodobacteraceae bacterium]|nr:ABC transporter permease [Paracoccaceae bacterium]